MIILAILKHSLKILSDNELLKSIKAAREIRGAKILYINTGIFMRLVDLSFCLGIILTISSLSEGGQKNEFYTCAPRKFNGILYKIQVYCIQFKYTVYCIQFKYTVYCIQFKYTVYCIQFKYTVYCIIQYTKYTSWISENNVIYNYISK